MITGVLIVSHPGGALLFHKSFSSSFGLSTTPSSQKWEAWNLAALLSAVQLYSANLSMDWQKHLATKSTVNTDLTTLAASTNHASLSCFSFNQSTLHFCYQKNTTDVNKNVGALTIVVVQGTPTKYDDHLASSISQAFAKHCHKKEITQPMRGFSSPFRVVLYDHLSYLVQQLSSIILTQYSFTVSWCEVVVQLPAPPCSTPNINSSSHSQNKEETIRPPLSSKQPCSSKSTRPKRHFLRFFRRKRNTTRLKAEPTPPPPPAEPKMDTPKNPKLQQLNHVSFSFQLSGTHSDIHRVIKKSSASSREEATSDKTGESSFCMSSKVYKGMSSCEWDIQVDILKSSDEQITLSMKSAMTTMIIPWCGTLGSLSNHTIQLIRVLHKSATFLATQKKH